VGNKVRDAQDADFLEASSPNIPLIGYLPVDMAVQEADRLGESVYDYVPAVRYAAKQIAEKLLIQTTGTDDQQPVKIGE
jgi:CO dehydrogenase nickel-insertion accessory protein CooC1